MDRKTILVVGAHMDDCELGAGGVIAKAVRRGHRVVLVNVASDYSSWQTTQGRETETREAVVRKAQEIGVDKRFLGYGYQQVPRDNSAIKKLAEVVIDVRPDITLFHNVRERAPSDHASVGYIAERAVRDATRVLDTYVDFSQEMYAYEVYPRGSAYDEFRPDVFVDITDVIAEVAQWPNFFDQIYDSQAPTRAAVKLDIHPGAELHLSIHGHMKLTTAAWRGHQSGSRYAEAFMSPDRSPLGATLLPDIVL